MVKTLLRIFSRPFGVFIVLLLMSISVSGHDKIIKPRNWLCYYGTTFGPEIYSKFDIVVLDGYNHPPLEKTDQNYPLLLGYLSIGEVDIDGPFWKLAKDKSYLVRKNEFWDSWIIDIRDPDWQQLIFKTAIPHILNQGFDGLFLDTLDSSLSLVEGNEGRNYEGIETALQGIIRKIKQNYPDKIITVNRGLPVLSKIAKYIDF
ncbi:MAG: endo alpha-1,4 polygalactosaminidase, partial [Nanoarchaeota archaeon]